MLPAEGPVTTAPAGPRRAWPIVITAVGLLVVLLGAILAVRLTRAPALPPAPHEASELGDIQASNEAWRSIAAHQDQWLALDEEALLAELFHAELPDDGVLVDRASLVASLAEPRRMGVTSLAPAFDGAALVDGCVDPPTECPGLALVRAAQHAEVVALSRWADGDRAGAAHLLSATLEAAMGLTRSGRTAMAQVIGTAMLARAVTVALVVVHIDRAEGQPLHVGLESSLTEVASLQVDLGRGWIGESLWVEPALRSMWEGAETRTRLFFDEGAAVRAIYDTYEGCVAFARGQAPSAPPMAHVPGVVDDDWRIAPGDALRIIDGIALECGRSVDLARRNLQVAQQRARRILER